MAIVSQEDVNLPFGNSHISNAMVTVGDEIDLSQKHATDGLEFENVPPPSIPRPAKSEGPHDISMSTTRIPPSLENDGVAEVARPFTIQKYALPLTRARTPRFMTPGSLPVSQTGQSNHLLSNPQCPPSSDCQLEKTVAIIPEGPMSPTVDTVAENDTAPAVSVKQEPIDNAIDLKPPKRRRVMMDAVVVPSLTSILKRQRIDSPKISDVELDKQLEKLKNPKVKQKQCTMLSLDTVRDRMRNVGCECYPIPLDEDIQEVTVTRLFMSTVYGGNTQDTRPNIGQKFHDVHPYRDFMYPSLDYNPIAPQRPGAPGLFFGTSSVAGDWPRVQRVITKIRSNVWQYLGQYKLTPAPSLTKEEWALQSDKVRNTWAKQICKQKWGRTARARIYLRKTLQRNYTPAELREALKSGRSFDEITFDEISQAFLNGEESICVWVMRCIGYDVDFQRNLAEKFPLFVPPPPKVKGKKTSSTERGSAANAKKEQQPKVGQKRKRIEEEYSDDEASSDDAASEDDSDAEEELTYTARGTRSRPISL